MSDAPKRDHGWLIHKRHRGWYRPEAKGYTANTSEAGRYSLTDALSYSHPNGMDGPRDGLTITHESDLPLPKPTDAADRIEALEAENERLREALERIAQWSEAYPTKVFPEPDFKRAATVLAAAGMSLDVISASNMRHATKGVGEIARAALQENSHE